MNPFDLPGPSFLIFYIALAAIVLISVKLIIDDGEGGAPRALPLGDPYQIAWLRGGTAEAVRIAVLCLTDRGLLAVSGNNLVNWQSGQLTFVKEPIERAVLERCAQSGTLATDVLKDPAVEGACASYRDQLERLQLTPDAGMLARRYRWFAFATAILLGVSLVKIVIAVGRGRSNVGFLIILTVVGLLAVWFLVRRRRTHLGNQMLNDLRRLFNGLWLRAERIQPGSMTSDVMLLAAVFGLSALPATGFADLRRIYKQSAGSGKGCGSACGSGCGGGGGGDGGGGGGCGGCGSSG